MLPKKNGFKIEEDRDSRDEEKGRFRLKWGLPIEPRKAQETSQPIIEPHTKRTKKETL